MTPQAYRECTQYRGDSTTILLSIILEHDVRQRGRLLIQGVYPMQGILFNNTILKYSVVPIWPPLPASDLREPSDPTLSARARIAADPALSIASE